MAIDRTMNKTYPNDMNKKWSHISHHWVWNAKNNIGCVSMSVLLSPCFELEQNANLQNAKVVIVFFYIDTFYTIIELIVACNLLFPWWFNVRSSQTGLLLELCIQQHILFSKVIKVYWWLWCANLAVRFVSIQISRPLPKYRKTNKQNWFNFFRMLNCYCMISYIYFRRIVYQTRHQMCVTGACVRELTKSQRRSLNTQRQSSSLTPITITRLTVFLRHSDFVNKCV